MRGDFSRITFDPSGTTRASGCSRAGSSSTATGTSTRTSPTTSSRVQARDVIGACGTPSDGEGFEIELAARTATSLSAPGGCTSTGIVAENDATAVEIEAFPRRRRSRCGHAGAGRAPAGAGSVGRGERRRRHADADARSPHVDDGPRTRRSHRRGRRLGALERRRTRAAAARPPTPPSRTCPSRRRSRRSPRAGEPTCSTSTSGGGTCPRSRTRASARRRSAGRHRHAHADRVAGAGRAGRLGERRARTSEHWALPSRDGRLTSDAVRRPRTSRTRA